MTSCALLVVSRVSRHCGGVQAVVDASVAISRGESLGLIGPNGAGKSTLLSMVAGALTPDSGSIRFDGEEIGGKPSHQVGSRGLIPKFPLSSGFPQLTVLQNLLVAAPRPRGRPLGRAIRGKAAWQAEEELPISRGSEKM